MVRPLLFLLLCSVPLQAHPGDHVLLNVTVRDNHADATLELPASMLANIDADGDFLITPEEGQAKRHLLRHHLHITTDGVPVAPSVQILPRPLWNKPPDDLLKRADELVKVQLHYRWPWTLRNLQVRWFPVSPRAECALTLSAFGQTTTARLTPQQDDTAVGPPARATVAVLWGAWRPALFLTVLGLAARHPLQGLVAALSGALIAPWLPANAWTALIACLVLTRRIPAAALLAAWIPAPLLAPWPALGTAIALLIALAAGRKLTPEQGLVCVALAAPLSFLA